MGCSNETEVDIEKDKKETNGETTGEGSKAKNHGKTREQNPESGKKPKSNKIEEEEPIIIIPKDNKGTFKESQWKQLMNKLPIAKTEIAAKKRKKIWDEMNAHNNGSVSLKKMTKDMEKYLNLPKIVIEKGCLEKAYEKSKSKVKTKQKGDDQFIQFSEFRIFLVYLKQYFEYWVMFENLDAGKDMTLSLSELKKSLEILKSYGVKIENFDEEFKVIDKNSSGKISFDEFAEYAIQKELELEPENDFDGEILCL